MCLKPDDANAASEATSACCPTYHIDPAQVNCDDAGTLCPPADWTYETNGAGLITDNPACTTCKDDSTKCFAGTQALWSDHCLQSGDSNINSGIAPAAGELVVKKGDNMFVDAYSAFMDNTQTIKTELDDELQTKGIKELFVVGIATEVCVQATVIDALGDKTGAYSVTLVKDATMDVLSNADTHAAAVTTMMEAGATIKTVDEVLAMTCPPAPGSASSTTTTEANTTGADGAATLYPLTLVLGASSLLLV